VEALLQERVHLRGRLHLEKEYKGIVLLRHTRWGGGDKVKKFDHKNAKKKMKIREP
jgi:hypothetical protein